MRDSPYTLPLWGPPSVEVLCWAWGIDDTLCKAARYSDKYSIWDTVMLKMIHR